MRLDRFALVASGLVVVLGVLATLTLAEQVPQFSEREALQQPMPGLTPDELVRFRQGRSLFNQSWVIAPSTDTEVDGLGPLYNRVACSSCHARNGQGGAPDQEGARMASMLVRLSVPGRNAHGGPKPHPVYGDQFNEEGVSGISGEGRIDIHWQYSTVTFDDGTQVELRRPQLRFRNLGYGPLGAVQTSARVSPSVAGMGLLEAVPDATLMAMANEEKPDGVKGRINRVWDARKNRTTIGRFGLKANMPTLYQQTAGAFAGDMGLTSRLFPQGNCTEKQTACRRAPGGGAPEITDIQMGAVVFYLAHLAPPPRRNLDDPLVMRGSVIFNSAGCTSCHRQALVSGPVAGSPYLSNRTFAPYTDLLLHDMGPDLADGRPDYRASGSEWRTPPLWGLGYLEAINPDTRYLHDGRARSFEEAILWHGGEGSVARLRYISLSRQEREALAAFLKSL
jgi:CxxC motif-containing protein (DUF1111 family)